MLSNTQDIFLPLVCICNQVHHETDAGDNEWGCGGSGLGNLFGMVYVTRADKNALYAQCTLCAMVCVT